MTTVPSPLSDRSVRLSAIGCAVGFGGFLVWSMTAPLEEGVHASGQVVVHDDRKQVQHYEGGIVAGLFVREGDSIEEGQVLLELEPLQSEAARDELAQDVAVQTATLERLTALRTEGAVPSFAALSGIDLGDVTLADIRRRQTLLFEQQRAAHAARLDLLKGRRQTLEGRARDLGGQIDATQAALAVGRDDLVLREQLLEERLETIGNVRLLTRELARGEAELARLVGERNEALAGIREIDDEIVSAQAELNERTGREMLEAQSALFAARERLRGTEDRLARTTIRAPIAGAVLNLNVATVGGVVRQGEPILEIVPSDGALIATVRLAPFDREAVRTGQRVEAQLTAYGRTVASARLEGRIIGVSADLLEDQTTATYYYEARVALDETGLDPVDRIEIVPGMPVTAFIRSGRSRTFMSYMLEPITATMRRGSRMD